MTIKALKNHFKKQLAAIYEADEMESFFFILAEYLHNLKRIDLVLNPNFEILEQDLKKWNAIITDLKNEKPIQYITGEAWFYGLRFEVNENTLIPRPETEELVEWVIEREKVKGKSKKLDIETNTPNKPSVHILDIGTGSGCIPISLKVNLPNANISAIDISAKALEMAQKNAKLNDVDVNFIQANILEVENLKALSTSNFPFSAKLDIIVSNPPYVRNLEKSEIKKNVLEFEPHLALFVADDDALLFYRKIAQLALKNLSPNGFLFFEINQYLGKKTVQLLENLGFKNIELRKDFKGNDRMIKASK